MTDEQEDEQERAQAEQLASALEHGHRPNAAVDDALEAAGVVRMLRAPVLSDERLDAVVQDGERRVRQARQRARTRFAIFGAAGTALAVAAAALLMVRAPHSEPSMASAPQAVPVSAAPLAETPASAPSASPAAARSAAQAAEQALRQAQLAWLEAPSTEARAALERALGAYRGEQLAMLAQRYEP